MPNASASQRPPLQHTSDHDGGQHAPRQHALASELQIAGLVPLSTVDWPGKLAATVFCQGCPWDCGYCHNPALIDCATPGTVDWSDVEALMTKRKGLLDAIVFTGGEATRQAALRPAMEAVRDAGLAVGLHTAGAYPNRLRSLALVTDWVGLDIKALPGDYGEVVGAAAGGSKAWKSLDILLSSGVDLEVRLTVYPNSVAAEGALMIAHEVHRRGASVFALQNARTEGTRSEFAERPRDNWEHEWAMICDAVSEVGFEDLRIR